MPTPIRSQTPDDRPTQAPPAGAAALPPPASAASGGARAADLSEREEAVLRLVALGYGNKEIGVRLRLSAKTVETYRDRAVKKLGLRGRVALVRHAARRGWFEALKEPGDGSSG